MHAPETVELLYPVPKGTVLVDRVESKPRDRRNRARMPSCPTGTLPGDVDTAELTLTNEELLDPGRLPSLVDAVRAVPAPRAQHLVVHPLPILLAVAACAKLCGATSVRGMIRWAKGQGAGVLAALEVPHGHPDRLPATTTVTRAFAGLDADAFDDALGRFVRDLTSDPLAEQAGPPRCDT